MFKFECFSSCLHSLGEATRTWWGCTADLCVSGIMNAERPGLNPTSTLSSLDWQREEEAPSGVNNWLSCIIWTHYHQIRCYSVISSIWAKSDLCEKKLFPLAVSHVYVLWRHFDPDVFSFSLRGKFWAWTAHLISCHNVLIWFFFFFFSPCSLTKPLWNTNLVFFLNHSEVVLIMCFGPSDLSRCD